MSKYKGKRIRFLARIVSLALVLAMLTESFLGSGNIVLAAEQEEIEIINRADSDNLEGVVGENEIVVRVKNIIRRTWISSLRWRRTETGQASTSA